MSPYQSREAPVPGSSVSETHPGFWSDAIKHEKVIYNRWYDNYGRFYYEKPSNEPDYGPINAYVAPLKERKYLHNGRVSPSQPVAYLKACLDEKKVRDAAAGMSSVRADVTCKCPLHLSHINHGRVSFYDRPDRMPYCDFPRDRASKHCCCTSSCVPPHHICTDVPFMTHKALPVARDIGNTRQRYIDLKCVPLNKNVQLAQCSTDKSSETRGSSFLSKVWDGRSCLRKDEPARKETETGDPCCDREVQRVLQKRRPNLIFCGPHEKGFLAPKPLQPLYSSTLHGGIKSSGITNKAGIGASVAKCTRHAMVDEMSCRKPQRLGVADVLTWCVPYHATQEGKRGT